MSPTATLEIPQDLKPQDGRFGAGPACQPELDGLRLTASMAIEGYGAAVLPSSAVPGWLTGDFRRIPIRGVPRRRVAGTCVAVTMEGRRPMLAEIQALVSAGSMTSSSSKTDAALVARPVATYSSTRAS